LSLNTVIKHYPEAHDLSWKIGQAIKQIMPSTNSIDEMEVLLESLILLSASTIKAHGGIAKCDSDKTLSEFLIKLFGVLSEMDIAYQEMHDGSH